MDHNVFVVLYTKLDFPKNVYSRRFNKMLSYRRELHCRVRYSFGQKRKTGTGRQYFTVIIGLSSIL